MESEQWIVVGTQMLRERLAGYCLVEHATERHAIDVRRLGADADDLAREVIHHNHDPIALEHNGLTSEQIETPKAVLHVSNEREPGWALGSGGRSEVLSEDATHDVLVDLDAERMSNLLRNARQPKRGLRYFISRIAAMSSFEGPF